MSVPSDGAGREGAIHDSREASIRAAGERLFAERHDALARRVDRFFAILMLGQWAFAVGLSCFLSPYQWSGVRRTLHVHVYMAVVLGGLITALPLLMTRLRGGRPETRHTIAVAQMLWSGLLIHLTGGRLETHFHIFGSLAFLGFYRDWKVLVPATVVVALDHMLRQLFWPESVYGTLDPAWWRFLEHSAWVVFEDVFLVLGCMRGAAEMRLYAHQQARVQVTERMQQEVKLAARIQTAILPRRTVVRGLEIAARMVPAEDVGGDYYDVLPIDGGCWIGIGDVAGHGLGAGLVMLQVQSAVEALAMDNPAMSPRDALCKLNRVMFENIRQRMLGDDYMTLNLIRYHDSGRLVVAGAHEEIIICRAATGRCNLVPVKGTWIGVMPDIDAMTVEMEVCLEPGDVVVLYTDGLPETMGAHGEQLGLERVAAAVEQNRGEPVERLRDSLFELAGAWAKGPPEDDVTVLVFRRELSAAGSREAQAA